MAVDSHAAAVLVGYDRKYWGTVERHRVGKHCPMGGGGDVVCCLQCSFGPTHMLSTLHPLCYCVVFSLLLLFLSTNLLVDYSDMLTNYIVLYI